MLTPGLEVIKLEYSLKLKIKCNDWLLVDTCHKQPIIALYFEFENELKFYNLEACLQEEGPEYRSKEIIGSLFSPCYITKILKAVLGRKIQPVISAHQNDL